MPYKLRNKVRHKFTKAKYAITNWKNYEKGLINIGNICIWFSEDAIKKWYSSDSIKTIGRQFKYSTLAIETGLILKIIFKLTYRSLEGFLGSMCKMMNIQLDIPDHTVFSRRAVTLKRLTLLLIVLDLNYLVKKNGLN